MASAEPHRCGAMTRKRRPCQCLVTWPGKRCHLHQYYGGMHAAAPMPNPPKLPRYVRAFDLGGSGLRTGMFKIHYCDAETIQGLELVPSSSAHLGQVDPGVSPAKWIRKKIPALDKEHGNVLMGASIAEVKKLFKGQKVPPDLKGAGLFETLGIKHHVHATVHDSFGHLFGTLHQGLLVDDRGVPENITEVKHPMIHFAFGTGATFLVTTSSGEIKAMSDFKKMLGGKPAWNYPVVCEDGKVRGLSRAFGGSSHGGPGNEARQTRRFKHFVFKQLVPRILAAGNTPPKTISLSGGAARGLEVGYMRGPKEAGLCGAALYAVKHFFGDVGGRGIDGK